MAMTNLTETELLMHRHLSLLKVLQTAGVQAQYVDGTWQVKLSEPAQQFEFNVSVAEEYRLPSLVEQNDDRTISCKNASMADIVKFICVRQMRGMYLLDEVCKTLGVALNSDGAWVADTSKSAPFNLTYAPQRYVQKVGGEVIFESDAPAMAPQWVQDFRANVEGPAPQFDDLPFDQSGQFKMDLIVNSDRHGYSYRYTNDAQSRRWFNSSRTLGPLAAELIAQLHAVMVRTSPAKVD